MTGDATSTTARMIVAATLTVAAGCADRTTPSPFEVVATTGRSATVAATDVDSYPTGGPATLRYRPVEGVGAATTVVTEPSDRFGSTWSVTERTGDTERTEYRDLDDDGNVVLLATAEPSDRAISIFTPPLVVAPRQLPGGAAETQVVDIRVVDIANVDRVREQGRVTQTIEHAGGQTIGVGGDLIDVACLSVRFEADLRMADARTTTLLYVEPGRGVVAIDRTKSISILGLPGREQRRLLVRDDAPDLSR